VSVDVALAALADPTRRELLGRLSRGPLSAGGLAQGFPVSRPAIAKHLRVLKQARLVEVERDGRLQVYRLAPQGQTEVEQALAEVSRFWERALEAFKEYAESDNRSP
jgi:DNA-binding transcriptional ArsR family regulator